MHITSRQNPLVKHIKSLHSAKARREAGLHIAEGEKLVYEAVNAGREVEAVFYEPGAEPAAALLAYAKRAYTVTRPVMEALGDTVSPQPILAAVRHEPPHMPDVFPAGMLVALDTLQDPGNLGAVIRTADAMGASGILLSEGCADPYAPKCMRAAMGSTYHVPLFAGNLYDMLLTLKNEGYCCISGHLRGQAELPRPAGRCVIVIGSEGSGVHEKIAALCVNVRIPMYGKAESLNASMAAGLLMYEMAKLMHGDS